MDDFLKIFDGYVHWNIFKNALFCKIVKVKYVTKKLNNIFILKNQNTITIFFIKMTYYILIWLTKVVEKKISVKKM